MSNATIILIGLVFVFGAWLLRRYQDKQQVSHQTGNQTQPKTNKWFNKAPINLYKELVMAFPEYLIKEHQTDENTAFLCKKTDEEDEIAIIKVDSKLTVEKKIQTMGKLVRITHQNTPNSKVLKQDISKKISELS